MSVFMILRVPADLDAFERYANANTELVMRIAAAGQAAGALHHTFAGADGELVVIDEWPDEASFQQFFDSQTEIPQLMREGGATGEPQVSLYRRLDVPDAF